MASQGRIPEESRELLMNKEIIAVNQERVQGRVRLSLRARRDQSQKMDRTLWGARAIAWPAVMAWTVSGCDLWQAQLVSSGMACQVGTRQWWCKTFGSSWMAS